jgi:hypothetical protein
MCRARQKALHRHGQDDASGEDQRLGTNTHEQREADQDEQLPTDGRTLQHERESQREGGECGKEQRFGHRERGVRQPRLEADQSRNAQAPALREERGAQARRPEWR